MIAIAAGTVLKVVGTTGSRNAGAMVEGLRRRKQAVAWQDRDRADQKDRDSQYSKKRSRSHRIPRRKMDRAELSTKTQARAAESAPGV
jgi:hypothetical protein